MIKYLNSTFIGNIKSLKLYQINVKIFLNIVIKNDIYIEILKGFSRYRFLTKVCKVNCIIYRLN